MKETGTLLLLGINAWNDYKKRQVCLWIIAAYGVCGLGMGLVSGRKLPDILAAVGIGIGFLCLSVISGDNLGKGDGWLITALGTMMEAGDLLLMLSIGLTLSALYAVILMVIFRKNRHTEIPLVPFLLAGYVGGLCL